MAETSFFDLRMGGSILYKHLEIMAMLDTMSVSAPRHLSEKRIVIYNENYKEKPRWAEFTMHTTENDVCIVCKIIDDTKIPRRESNFTIVRCVQHDDNGNIIVYTYEPSTIWDILQAKDRSYTLAFFKTIWNNFTLKCEMDIAPDLQLFGKEWLE